MTERKIKSGKLTITQYVCDSCGEGILRFRENWSYLKTDNIYYYECELCTHKQWLNKLYDLIKDN